VCRKCNARRLSRKRLSERRESPKKAANAAAFALRPDDSL
jgi:hypothetical protein